MSAHGVFLNSIWGTSWIFDRIRRVALPPSGYQSNVDISGSLNMRALPKRYGADGKQQSGRSPWGSLAEQRGPHHYASNMHPPSPARPTPLAVKRGAPSQADGAPCLTPTTRCRAQRLAHTYLPFQRPLLPGACRPGGCAKVREGSLIQARGRNIEG